MLNEEGREQIWVQDSSKETLITPRVLDLDCSWRKICTVRHIMSYALQFTECIPFLALLVGKWPYLSVKL